MFYIVRVYLTKDKRTERIRVKADTGTAAISHVLAQDWTIEERKACVAVTVNEESLEQERPEA